VPGIAYNAAMYRTCPKCGYERRPADAGDMGACPACGLVFVKWLRHHTGMPARSDVSAVEEGPGEPRFLARLWVRLTYVPERTEPVAFWGRVAAYAAIFAWGWYFILLDFRTNEIGESFMHNINLAFHEAGHLAFIPFGRFMAVLGGSLGQLIMPLIVMAAFLWKHHDSFGASMALWWTGQSLMDLAPYINDARALQLPLVGGGTGADRPGAHDWQNILLDLNMIQHDHRIAWAADACGSLVLLVALAWGGYLLYRQYRNLL
jgi:hypothetical protein